MKYVSSRSVKRSSQHGFTLLEVMVVVLIVGIILSMASLNVFNSADKQLEEQARRFAALVQLANEESIINNTSYALALSRAGYQFFILDAGNKAVPVPPTEQAFRAREIPAWSWFKAEINGEEVKLPDSLKTRLNKSSKPKDEDSLAGDREQASEEDYLDDDVPRILFLSSGEMTPFEVSIESEEGSIYSISGDFTGKVKYLGRTDS